MDGNVRIVKLSEQAICRPKNLSSTKLKTNIPYREVEPMGIMEKIKALFGGASSESEEPEVAEAATTDDSAEESGDTTSNW